MNLQQEYVSLKRRKKKEETKRDWKKRVRVINLQAQRERKESYLAK